MSGGQGSSLGRTLPKGNRNVLRAGGGGMVSEELFMCCRCAGRAAQMLRTYTAQVGGSQHVACGHQRRECWCPCPAVLTNSHRDSDSVPSPHPSRKDAQHAEGLASSSDSKPRATGSWSSGRLRGLGVSVHKLRGCLHQLHSCALVPEPGTQGRHPHLTVLFTVHPSSTACFQNSPHLP